MGHVADAVLQHGGRAVGVIPETLVQKQVAHESLTTLHVVKDMHERKVLMYKLADAFVAMPGGTGTLDEFFEVFTWTQLGLLLKPLGLLNVAGYFNHLAAFLRHSVAERFVTPEHLDMLVVEERRKDCFSDCAHRRQSCRTSGLTGHEDAPRYVFSRILNVVPAPTALCLTNNFPLW